MVLHDELGRFAKCFLLAPVLAAFLNFSTTWAEENLSISVPRVEKAIVDQRVYRDSENGCGPACLLNLLKFSSERYQGAYQDLLGRTEEARMRYVIDRYFRNRRSEVVPGQKRWGVHGVVSEDLVAGLNELLAENDIEAFRGAYLDRRKDEPDEEMIERVHRLFERSIENGVAPILSLRSFRVTEGENGEPGWQSGHHHNVVVVGISPIREGLGFTAEVLDSWGGVRNHLLIHREPGQQPFRALKGTEDFGRWLTGSPFLEVVAPGMTSLRPRDLKWSERLVVTANYAIGDF